MSWINRKVAEPELSSQASAWLFCNKIGVEECKNVKGILHLNTNLGPMIYQPITDEIAKYNEKRHEWAVVYPHFKSVVHAMDLFKPNEKEAANEKSK